MKVSTNDRGINYKLMYKYSITFFVLGAWV